MIYEKLTNGIYGHLTKEEILYYFNTCVNELNLTRNYSLNVLAKKEDYHKTACQKNQFTLDFKMMLSLFYQSHPYNLDSVIEFNILIIEYIHAIIAYIKLREDIEYGFMHLMEPEAFVCFVKEITIPNSKKMLLNHYCALAAKINTIKLLEEISKDYPSEYPIKQYKEKYIASTKEAIQKQQKEKTSLLRNAILKDNTPDFVLFNPKAISEETIVNEFSTKVAKNYKQAIQLFTKRNHWSLQINFLMKKYQNLSNNSLSNKLLLGKEFTNLEKNEIKDLDLSTLELPDFSEIAWIQETNYKQTKMR